MATSYPPSPEQYEEASDDQEYHKLKKNDSDDFAKAEEEELFLEHQIFSSHQEQRSSKQKLYLAAIFAILICIVSLGFGTYSSLRLRALQSNPNCADIHQQSEHHSHASHEAEHKHSHESHDHKHEISPALPSQPTYPAHPDLDCGDSEASAIAAGCTFNFMAFSYVPSACNGDDIMSAFIDEHAALPLDGAGIFPWYRWSNRTEPVPQDASQLSKYPFIWTTHEWHVAHCLYNWALTTDAISRVLKGEKEVWILQDAVQDGHIAHCNGLVSDRVTSGLTPLRAFRAIGRCVNLRVDTGDIATLNDDPYGSHTD